MDILETVSATIGTVFNWYANNAGPIFTVLILTAIFGEKAVQWLRRKEINFASSLTSLLSGAGFLIAKTILEKLIFVGLAYYIYDLSLIHI